MLLLMMLVPLLSSKSTTWALQCGKRLTKDCLGDTDRRYDPDASDNILDQAEIWNKLDGYFECDGDSSGIVEGNRIAFNMSTWFNMTFIGTRYYRHEIVIGKEIATAFNGDVFATSTFERDGTMQAMGAVAANNMGEGAQPGSDSIPVTDTGKHSPIDTNSAFSVIDINTNTLRYESCVFLDDDAFRLVYETFTTQSENPRTPDFVGALTCVRLATADTWTLGVNTAYEEYNIPTETRFTVPSDCLTGSCPTEEQWRQQDPNFATSPYLEPDASLTGGTIAWIVVLCVVLVGSVAAGINWYLLRTQSQRYKTAFARRVAANLEVRPSMTSTAMTPNALAAEFKKIDSSTNDGKISRDELWKFVQEGSMGEISKSDFNALFSAMDTSGTNNINFLEFCAFLNSCHDEFVEARRGGTAQQRGEQINHLSRQISTRLTSQEFMKSAPSAKEVVNETENTE